MLRNYIKFILFVSLTFFLLSGCTRSTSVLLKVENKEMSVERFSRGQIFMGMQCVACPHVGAEVEIRDTNDNLICNGVHEEIVPFGYERIFFRVVCAGLESYINQSVKIKVDGFIDGNTDHMKNVSFTDEKIVKFEKV